MGSVYRPTYKDRHGNKQVSDVWWISYYRDGRKMRESSDSDKETVARNLLKLREGEVVRGVPVTPRASRIKFDELAADMVNDYRVNGKRSIEDLERRLKLHILPFFGGRRTAAISTADVREFIARRQAAGASAGEINRELTGVKRAFSLGMQAGKILARPHIPMLHENNTRTGFFEREQFETLLRHLPDYVQPVIRFAYITGWRLYSEILSLQWHQVDFGARQVLLEAGKTKNDEARVFPFTVELEALLLERRGLTEQLQKKHGTVIPWVFHYGPGKQLKTFRTSWRSACRKAGLPGKIPHDFRRTAVRNLVRAGIPERVAMQMTGHKTRSVFERYNVTSPGDLLEAARKLDELAGKDTGKDRPFRVVPANSGRKGRSQR